MKKRLSIATTRSCCATAWISASSKSLVLSEYRSFVEKFRSCVPDYDRDWVCFLSGNYSLSSISDIPPTLSLSSLNLSTDTGEFFYVYVVYSQLCLECRTCLCYSITLGPWPLFSLCWVKATVSWRTRNFLCGTSLLNRVEARHICAVY